MNNFVIVCKMMCLYLKFRQAYFFLIILCCNALFSQTKTGYVVYESYLNLGLPHRTSKILYFSGHESFFIEIDSFHNKKEEKKLYVKEIDVNYEAKTSTYTNLLIGKILSQELVFTDAYVVEEDIPNREWDILNEHKKIGSFTCQKATIKFRGRVYVAWFTSEIPVPFGPWKFNKLPGIILEVEDTEHKISFSATIVVINPDAALETNIKSKIKTPNVGDKVTLAEFVPILDNEAKVFEKFIMAKEGRDSGLKLVKKGGRENRYEVTYEWEKTFPNGKKQ